MNDQYRGVVLCPVDERHDEQWVLETLARLADLPGIDAIEVERTSVGNDEFLHLGVEFETEDAFERFTTRDDECCLLAVLDLKLEARDRP